MRQHFTRALEIILWAVIGAGIVIGLFACTPDLLGPSDSAWQEECVVWVTPDEPVIITRAMFDRCESLQVWIVKVGR